MDEIVFLLDVDNTLLDNDRIQAELKKYLDREVGLESCKQYWAIFEQLRSELGYADYLGALQRYRVQHLDDPRLLVVSSFLVDYPFANRLYPDSLDVIDHLRQWGPTVILSDGDVVFQPRKIERSGLWRAVVLNGQRAAAVEQNAREHGLLVNAVKPDVIRLAPPLILTETDVDEAMPRLRAALGDADA